MELELGNDGYYAICYQSETTPNKWDLRPVFDPYGLIIRVDEVKRWVFLRSLNKKDIQRCLEELGDTYNFRPCRNSKKRSQYNDQPEMTNSNLNTTGHNNNAARKNDVSDGLYLGVIIRLSRDFTEQEIQNILEGFNIYPHEIEKGYTRNLTSYCNIYFKTEEGVASLCKKVDGYGYKGRNLSVKDANDLLL